MERPATLAIVIPALDEEGVISTVVKGFRAAIPASLSGRVIVVDNGSTDRTAALAVRAGATVVSEPKRGYGRACRAGVEAAAGAEVVVLADGDGADDPSDLAAILGPILDGSADLVVGTRGAGRREPGSMTPQQLSGNFVATRVIRGLYRTPVTDLGPFRAIRRADLLTLRMSEQTFGWSTEMVVKALRAGYRYREVPVAYRRRAGGVSKVGGNLGASVVVGIAIFGTALRHAFR